jgi:radical SAM superfamily enzyme YgiQ (UPF0313 family)
MKYLQELKEESFSGRIAFINLNVRGRFALSRTQPPLGLLSLIGICQELSIPHGFIDADAYDLDDDDVIKALAAGNYAYVGVSLLSLRVSHIFPLLARIKRELEIKLIVGGPLPTADSAWLMEQCPPIDYSVLGEGESVLPNLLLAIEGKEAWQDVAGITFRSDGKLFTTPHNRDFFPGDEVPMPGFGSIDFRYYSGASPVGAWPSANLLVTRGCPYHCSFCSNPVWNHKPNFIPVPTIIRWIEYLRRKGIHEIFFVDDTMNLDADWFEELCRALMKSQLNRSLVFKAPFRGNLTNPNQLKLAHQAGFWLIFYGVESGNQTVLDYYRKGERLDELASAISWTRNANLKSQASMIAGAPIDTVETLLQTANFLRETDPDYAPTHPLIPYMGTKIADDIINEGILTPEEIRTYDHTKPLIRTKTLRTDELLEIIDFMRNDFQEYKISNLRSIKRRHELIAGGIDEKQITDILQEEKREAAFLVPDGVPRQVAFRRDDSRLKDLGDELLCFTSDIRLTESHWYECERGFFRWSYPFFECPFYLADPKDTLELFWASMRKEKVSLKIWVNEEPAISFSIQKPDWRKDQIPLPKMLKGIVWLRVEILSPFFPQGDSRKLGLAFQSIRFLSLMSGRP